VYQVCSTAERLIISANCAVAEIMFDLADAMRSMAFEVSLITAECDSANYLANARNLSGLSSVAVAAVPSMSIDSFLIYNYLS
jgi:hypothetical protein